MAYLGGSRVSSTHDDCSIDGCEDYDDTYYDEDQCAHIAFIRSGYNVRSLQEEYYS